MNKFICLFFGFVFCACDAEPAQNRQNNEQNRACVQLNPAECISAKYAAKCEPDGQKCKDRVSHIPTKACSDFKSSATCDSAVVPGGCFYLGVTNGCKEIATIDIADISSEAMCTDAKLKSKGFIWAGLSKSATQGGCQKSSAVLCANYSEAKACIDAKTTTANRVDCDWIPTSSECKDRITTTATKCADYGTKKTECNTSALECYFLNNTCFDGTALTEYYANNPDKLEEYTTNLLTVINKLPVSNPNYKTEFKWLVDIIIKTYLDRDAVAKAFIPNNFSVNFQADWINGTRHMQTLIMPYGGVRLFLESPHIYGILAALFTKLLIAHNALAPADAKRIPECAGLTKLSDSPYGNAEICRDRLVAQNPAKFLEDARQEVQNITIRTFKEFAYILHLIARLSEEDSNGTTTYILNNLPTSCVPARMTELALILRKLKNPAEAILDESKGPKDTLKEIVKAAYDTVALDNKRGRFPDKKLSTVAAEVTRRVIAALPATSPLLKGPKAKEELIKDLLEDYVLNDIYGDVDNAFF